MARRVGSTGEKTARAIRDAAIVLFAERGYAAVSMRALADHVGIQVSALYNHFETKQDVLATVMVEHLEEVLASWEAMPGRNDDPERALEAFARFHVRYHVDRQREVFISFMELRSLEDDNFRVVEALRKSYEHEIRDILETGRKRGIFDIKDAHVTAMALLAMVTGVTTWFKPTGRLSAQEIEEVYVAMVMQAVGADYQTAIDQKKAG
ncbi:MAG: TetR/AcrR family transcriptional regulator [Pseudomonadota bacterium]